MINVLWSLLLILPTSSRLITSAGLFTITRSKIFLRTWVGKSTIWWRKFDSRVSKNNLPLLSTRLCVQSTRGKLKSPIIMFFSPLRQFIISQSFSVFCLLELGDLYFTVNVKVSEALLETNLKCQNWLKSLLLLRHKTLSPVLKKAKIPPPHQMIWNSQMEISKNYKS